MADSDQQIVSLIIDRLRSGCRRLAVRTLELRMETSKHLANVEDEFVKRLHDRCPVSEQYLNSDIHVHIQFTDGGMCWATYRKVEGRVLGIDRTVRNDDLSGNGKARRCCEACPDQLVEAPHAALKDSLEES